MRQRSCRGYSESNVRPDPSNKQPTTDDQLDPHKVFQVTHPFHPLYGQEFALIERRSAWGEERVYFHDDSGRLRRIAAAWTNAAGPDPFDMVSGGRSHFRIDDLLQLVALIERQNAAKRLSKVTHCHPSVSSK